MIQSVISNNLDNKTNGIVGILKDSKYKKAFVKDTVYDLFDLTPCSVYNPLQPALNIKKHSKTEEAENSPLPMRHQSVRLFSTDMFKKPLNITQVIKEESAGSSSESAKSASESHVQDA